MKTNSIGFIFDFWIFRILIIVIFNFNQHQCTVVELNDRNFAQVVSSRPFTMVAFYADWCHHCEDLIPQLEAADEVLVQNRIHAIAKVDQLEFSIVIIVEKINCNGGGKETCDKMKIMAFPTIYIMLYGKVASQYKDEYDAKKIIDYIVSKLNDILGSNVGLNKANPQYNYIPNYLASQSFLTQQHYPANQNYQPPNIDEKISSDSWMEYDVYKYNQNNGDFRQRNYYNPQLSNSNYLNFWPNLNLNYPNFPTPINPMFPFDNTMYQNSPEYLYNTLENNQFYKSLYPLKIQQYKYPSLNSNHYLQSIAWGGRAPIIPLNQDANPWYDTNPYFQPLNNFLGYPKSKTNWFEYAGLKKQNISPKLKNGQKISKSKIDWEWNPDLDLGHRPAIRQYMVPSKYRSNAIKSIYLRNILDKYLNRKEFIEDGKIRKHLIANAKSKNDRLTLENLSTDTAHSPKNSESLKLITDALRNIKKTK